MTHKDSADTSHGSYARLTGLTNDVAPAAQRRLCISLLLDKIEVEDI
jgi:hypothetical protein